MCEIWKTALDAYRRLAGPAPGSALYLTDGAGPPARVLRQKPDRINSFRIPHEILETTQAALRQAGDKKSEGLVFWAGILQGNEALITRCVNPSGHGTPVSATVTYRGLRELLSILREKGEFLFVQVHSHPEEAFHSETDDSEAISFKIGFISIVVPYFGAVQMTTLLNCKVFEYKGGGRWAKLSMPEVKERFQII